jgi:hypothetical protein
MGGSIFGVSLMAFGISLGIAGVSLLMLPFAAIWTAVALWLGRDYKRRALLLKGMGIE